MRILSRTIALAVVVLLFPTSVLAVQYLAEGRLSRVEDTGLAATTDLGGAYFAYLIDVEPDIHAIFPTRLSGPSGSDVLGRFAGISSQFTIRDGTTNAVLFEYFELLTDTSIPLGTTNQALGADSFSVGIPLSNLTPGIDGTRFTVLPSVFATLAQPYSLFTTFETASGTIDNVALPPSAAELVAATILGVGRLRIVSLSDESLYSAYELVDASLTAIPEPSTALSIGIGLILLAARRFRAKTTSKHFFHLALCGTAILALISASPGSAFNPRQCWNVDACPGSINDLQYQQTFSTFLDTDTNSSDH